jgi:thiol-disulfide isomerase/thioredoxin
VFLFGFLSGGCATTASGLTASARHLHFGVHGLPEESEEAIAEITAAVEALPGVLSVHYQGATGRFGVEVRGGLEPHLDPLVGAVRAVGERTGRGYHLVWGGKPQGLDRLPEPTWSGTFTTLGGETVVLEEVVGTAPVLVTFWATWCAACLKESVYLQLFFETYGERVRFLSFNINPPQDREMVTRFVSMGGLTYPIPLDPEGDFLDTLKVEALPYTLVLNAKGEPLYQENTFREAELPLLEEALKRAAP